MFNQYHRQLNTFFWEIPLKSLFPPKSLNYSFISICIKRTALKALISGFPSILKLIWNTLTKSAYSPLTPWIFSLTQFHKFFHITLSLIYFLNTEWIKRLQKSKDCPVPPGYFYPCPHLYWLVLTIAGRWIRFRKI